MDWNTAPLAHVAPDREEGTRQAPPAPQSLEAKIQWPGMWGGGGKSQVEEEASKSV